MIVMLNFSSWKELGNQKKRLKSTCPNILVYTVLNFYLWYHASYIYVCHKFYHLIDFVPLFIRKKVGRIYIYLSLYRKISSLNIHGRVRKYFLLIFMVGLKNIYLLTSLAIIKNVYPPNIHGTLKISISCLSW